MIKNNQTEVNTDIMEKINVETSGFQVVRILEINGKIVTCQYFERFELSDINEFVSVYRIMSSTDEDYEGRIIFGHEKFTDTSQATLTEEFFFPPDYVYDNTSRVMIYAKVQKIVMEYYETTYTNKTGLSDYDNLEVLDNGGEVELFPTYKEESYAYI